MTQGKIILFSAPSGSGKSTIIRELTENYGLQGRFSISATSRPPRGSEQDGVDYHFLTQDAFEAKIQEGAFVEYEQVYQGLYYGTLRSELDTVLARGEYVILDIDVKGGNAGKGGVWYPSGHPFYYAPFHRSASRTPPETSDRFAREDR